MDKNCWDQLSQCYTNVVSVWYRPVGEIRQQDKMTTAQIYYNNNNQFQRCVYKAYIKWLGTLLPGCTPMVM